MTKNNRADRKDGDGKLEGTQSPRARRLRIARLALLALIMVFALGISRCPPPDKAAAVPCQDFNLLVEPGTCVVFANPCSDHQWARPPKTDGFRLDDADRPSDAQIWLLTERNGDETTRSICVGAESPLHKPFGIGFTYEREMDLRYGIGTDYGLASVILTVAPPLTVSVSASPSTIAFGGSSQLVATASGGIPPYFYSWAPDSNLDRSNVAAPIATPPATKSFRVTITDSGSQYVTSGPVTVYVRAQLTVTANPQEVFAGDPLALSAITQGGSPPFSFNWTPEVGLDDPHRVDPIARPTTTTTYHATATDTAGAVVEGSVTVLVRPRPTPTPTPTPEPTPTPTPTPTPEPTPTPTPTPLTASFVFTRTCCPTINLDASASTGNIVSYAWDLSWTAASTDRVISSPTTSFAVLEFNRGTITLTVTDVNGNTATVAHNYP